MKDLFHKASTKVSNAAGAPITFLLAVAIVIIWAMTGPMFGFSDTWQLFINTGTTIMTFLMVFLIQNTQNRDGKAVQLKLDELIRSNKGARDEFVGLESLSDDELNALDSEFAKLHEMREKSAVMRKLHSTIEAENQRRREKNLAYKAAKATMAMGKASGNAVSGASQAAVNVFKSQTPPDQDKH
ncbi:MAG: low affinity iron permease family protein [bacterium]|nr:low affinity iron permease family protein [bacterium]